MIKCLLKGKEKLKILEIGAWNGWLSQHLVKWGHSLTTLDYFDSEYDGLEAMKYYPEKWIALQMEVEDISVLAGKYDVIILNRCYAYYTHPIDMLGQLKGKLSEGGMMILTGLHFYKDGESRRKEFESYKAAFKEENGFGMMSKETKGYLDFQDKADLAAAEVEFGWYWGMVGYMVKGKVLRKGGELFWGRLNK